MFGSSQLPGAATSLEQAVLNYDSNPNRIGGVLTMNQVMGVSGRLLAEVNIRDIKPEGSESESYLDKILEGTSSVIKKIDKPTAITEALGFVAKHSKLLRVTGEKAFDFISNVVGLAVIADDFYDAYKAGKKENGVRQYGMLQKEQARDFLCILAVVKERSCSREQE